LLKTDADGKWSFQCVPESMKEVSVEIDHSDFMPERHSLTRAQFAIANGQQPAAKMELKRGLTVTGMVVDDAGKPIAGALIRAKFMNNVRQTKTKDDGTYMLSGCEPRLARVVVSAKGRAMDLKQVRVEEGMEP